MQGQAGKGFGIQKNPQTARGSGFKRTPKPKRKDWHGNNNKKPPIPKNGIGAKSIIRTPKPQGVWNSK
jgi:hypothetical protein